MSLFAPKRYAVDGALGANSDCTPGAQLNKKLLLERSSTQVLQVTVPVTAGLQTLAAWTTDVGEPGMVDWPNGDFDLSWDVTLLPADTQFRVQWYVVSSSCSVLFGPINGAAGNSTGIYTHSHTLDVPSSAATDRLQVRLQTLKTTGSPGAMRIAANDDSWVQGPFRPYPHGPLGVLTARQAALDPILVR